MPFLVGIALAYMGDPLVDRLEALKVQRTVAVLTVFLLIMLIISAALLVLLPMIVRELATLIREIPNMIIWLQTTTSPIFLEYFGVDPFDISLSELKATLTGNWQKVGGLATTILKEITQSGAVLVLWVTNLALIPVVAFYLMRDWDLLMDKLRNLLPRQSEGTIVKLVSECDEVLSAFIRGQLLIMFILGCAYALGLWLVGLELAVLLGMLAGLASIVPYLGFIIGIISAGVAAFFQFQDLLPLVYVAIVFGVGQLLEGMILTPVLVGDRIGLHPVAVIFAILAGGQLFGFVGVLLALPVAAVIMVFIRHLHDSYLESAYYESQNQ
jgi:predicted PurR-regulated permease PerM